MNGNSYANRYSRWILPSLGVLNFGTLAIIAFVVCLRGAFKLLRGTYRLIRKLSIAVFHLSRRLERWARQ